MCDRIISFSIRYVPDQYKTQQMCDKPVDDCIKPISITDPWHVVGGAHPPNKNSPHTTPYKKRGKK